MCWLTSFINFHLASRRYELMRWLVGGGCLFITLSLGAIVSLTYERNLNLSSAFRIAHLNTRYEQKLYQHTNTGWSSCMVLVLGSACEMSRVYFSIEPRPAQTRVIDGGRESCFVEANRCLWGVQQQQRLLRSSGYLV